MHELFLHLHSFVLLAKKQQKNPPTCLVIVYIFCHCSNYPNNPQPNLRWSTNSQLRLLFLLITISSLSPINSPFDLHDRGGQESAIAEPTCCLLCPINFLLLLAAELKVQYWSLTLGEDKVENRDGFHIYYLMEFLLLEKAMDFLPLKLWKCVSICVCVCVCVQAQNDASVGWINAVSRIWWKVAPRLYGLLKHSGKCTLWMCIDLLLSKWPSQRSAHIHRLSCVEHCIKCWHTQWCCDGAVFRLLWQRGSTFSYSTL